MKSGYLDSGEDSSPELGNTKQVLSLSGPSVSLIINERLGLDHSRINYLSVEILFHFSSSLAFLSSWPMWPLTQQFLLLFFFLGQPQLAIN